MSNEIKHKLFGLPVTEEEYHFIATEFRQRIMDMISVQIDKDVEGIMQALQNYAADALPDRLIGINKRIEFKPSEIQYIMARAKLYSERGTLGAAQELLEQK